MIGLRTWRRDAALPALAGDGGLVPPDEREVLALVAEHLLQTGAPAPVEADWTYARWKPRRSTAAGYVVAFADGERRAIGVKLYAGEKAAHLDARPEAEMPPDVADEHLRPFAAIPQRRLAVWSFPFDRELPGLARAFDLRRTSRLLRELAVFAPLRVRAGSSTAEVLRYRPERRAVLKLDLRLRPEGGGPKVARALAARVLPPAEAVRIARARRTCEATPAGALLPALVASQERTGTLFEEWIDALVPAPDDFSHAERAGMALGLLQRAGGAPARPLPRPSLRDLGPLFEADPGLAALAGAIGEDAPPRELAWVHGDLHPDQVAWDREQGRTRLLDLDRLAAGDPARDLATWVADHLASFPATELREAAGPLLAGLARAGAPPIPLERIAAAVSSELARLAAAGLRRLELGAVAKARALLERGRDVAPRGGGRP